MVNGRLRLALGIVVAVVALGIGVWLVLPRGTDEVLVPDSSTTTLQEFALERPLSGSVPPVEVTSLFGSADATRFAAAQTVTLQSGEVTSVEFRTPPSPGQGAADVVVEVSVHAGDPFAGLDALEQLGSTTLSYRSTEQAAVRRAVFEPAVRIPADGEYVVVISLASAEPDRFSGFEPITVVTGDAYDGGRAFNLRADGVTNPDLWADLDYLIAVQGSAVPS